MMNGEKYSPRCINNQNMDENNMAYHALVKGAKMKVPYKANAGANVIVMLLNVDASYIIESTLIKHCNKIVKLSKKLFDAMTGSVSIQSR